jgi:hypothetical protein
MLAWSFSQDGLSLLVSLSTFRFGGTFFSALLPLILDVNERFYSWVQGFAPPAIDVDGCELQPMAEQFFTILLADMTVGQILDVGVPLLRLLFQRCCRGKLTGPRFETGRVRRRPP